MKIQVPVIRKTDVLVIGGTAAACHLASALRRKNRSVFCVTPYTYFGEELCARLDFAPEKLERLNRFGITVWNRNPAGIKQLLDSVLISAGVEYLYQNNPVAPLFDAAGAVSSPGAAASSRSPPMRSSTPPPTACSPRLRPGAAGTP